MVATGEAVKCRCRMRMIPNGHGALICPNCDQLQPQEVMGFARRQTKQDIAFEMYWLQTIDAEYEDNTQAEVPEPADEPEGETPEVPDEGENDGS